MTASTKTTIKALFQTGDKPSQSNFIDFIDSYQDYSASLTVISSGSTGMVAKASAGGFAARTITGTTSEISVSAGDGATNPTISLPATLVLTGKAVTVATASAASNDTTAASTAFVVSAVAASVTYGAYTVALTCSTSGTVTLDASFNAGTYERIGNVVHVKGYVQVSSVSSPTGKLRISLPFVVATVITDRDTWAACSVVFDVTVSAGAGAIPALLSAGVSYIETYLNGTTGIGVTSAAQMQAGSVVFFQATYRTE